MGEKIGGDEMRPGWACVTNKRRHDVDDVASGGEGASSLGRQRPIGGAARICFSGVKRTVWDADYLNRGGGIGICLSAWYKKL